MPKVTEKQKIKQKELLEKFLQSQKGLKKKQISKHWQKYRAKKYVITELPKYRKKLARAKDEIESAILREKYFERKEIKTLKVEYGDLIPTKKKKHKYSGQEYFRIRKGADIDSTIRKVFDNERKKVRYVLLTLKIKLAETGQIIYVSNTYTPSSFENLQGLEVTALENTLEKLSFVAKYDGFVLLSTHLRLVYALPEKSSK